MEPNSLEYQKSIAQEFNAVKNRVRHLIGSAHWGEDGRYKEIILMNFLKRFLPNTIAVGTGFIKNGNCLSSQIDIIIYNPAIPVYFKENDFVIVQPKSVLGIIEVKSNPDKNKIAEAVFKATEAGQVVEEPIFNGIFIFGEAKERNNNASKLLEKSRGMSYFKESMLSSLRHLNGVNHIVSNDGAFIKKWAESNEFCSYSISELATSYFFSNLLEIINASNELQVITGSMYEHLYPISEGKEKHKRWTLKSDGSFA